KNHTVYSDKLRLSVLDLTHMELATEKDRLHHTNKWAALFKATAWEEIKMYAQTNEYIQEAANTIYQLTQEERIRQQCEARDDYYRRQRSVQHYIEEQAEQISEQNSIIASLEATVRQNNSIIAKLQAEIDSLKR
ncbi:MAG: Rpn family recombination-promoting nuclease/putative transposase, partial [Roseburia sp.]|nr:Rpn family recombination-promoting nuclease/putative transposase [Roseburia sp.]MCM1099556.1 Rpn family recombination-promoting nuclease/putative transposase [Ruminococcus flavefaciens]